MSRINGFSIEVTSFPVAESFTVRNAEAYGRITVGEFSETFRLDLSYWSVDDYRRNWRRALQMLEGREIVDSCLISSMTDPASSNFISCWPLYRRGGDVFVQNSLIFLDEIDGDFNVDEPWLFIGPRTTVNEDGDRVSEWRTDISEVRKFMRNDLEN